MLSPAAASLLALFAAAGVQAQNVQQLWGQCGGQGWTGPTQCVSGAYCFQQNQWYHQCIPGTGTTTAAPAPTTLTTSTTSVGGGGPTTTTTVPGGSNPTACPAVPGSMPSGSTQLNDPFTFASGGRVSSKADFTCRQAEISALMQRYELGELPPKPSVSATFSGSTLSITVTANGKSVSFSVTVNRPSSGSGPFPAIISYGSYGSSIPVPAGVATILFNNDDIAQQTNTGSRGKGKFYDLYGSGHSAGALTAWAWGVGRILDALELVRSQANIDPARVGVTGCSRNGKGAIVAGALEPRIALTIPQESGSGGSACWRLSNWQNQNGYNVQASQQIITENVWFSKNFEPYVNNVNQLPFDHHLLASLVAPRPLYVIENSDMEWLGKISTYGCMGAARKTWEALGALDRFGYSQVGGNQHCSFNSGQQSAELNAFIGKYLLNNGGAGNTAIFRSTDSAASNFNFNSWCPWTVPSLS